jgi:hypothetical protein
MFSKSTNKLWNLCNNNMSSSNESSGEPVGLLGEKGISFRQYMGGFYSEYWLKMEEALAKARLKYLTQPPPLEQSPTSTPPSQHPPPKPTRTPHLTDDTF